MSSMALEDLIMQFLVKRCGAEQTAPLERNGTLLQLLSGYNLDSLDLIDLQFDIEEKFGITIDDAVPIFEMNLGQIEDHVMALRAKHIDLNEATPLAR